MLSVFEDRVDKFNTLQATELCIQQLWHLRINLQNRNLGPLSIPSEGTADELRSFLLLIAFE